MDRNNCIKKPQPTVHPLRHVPKPCPQSTAPLSAGCQCLQGTQGTPGPELGWMQAEERLILPLPWPEKLSTGLLAGWGCLSEPTNCMSPVPPHCWGREGMRCVGAKIACPPGTVLGNHCVHACNSTSLWPVTRDNPRVRFLLSQHMSSFSAGRWGSWEAPAQMKQLSCWISPPAADENHCFLPQPPLASPCPAPCAC